MRWGAVWCGERKVRVKIKVKVKVNMKVEAMMEVEVEVAAMRDRGNEKNHKRRSGRARPGARA